MAEEKKYSFITVETDDDDDIVIQAGSPAEPALEVEEPLVSAVPAVEPVAAEAAQAVDAVSAQEEAPEPYEAPVAPKKAKDAYRETTLEDLDAAPMGLTQKVVIAVAVVAVIAFAAWYILF